MRKVYFPQPDAQLPIKLKTCYGGDPATRTFTWGRREKEAGHLPVTGWARLDSIKAGKWDQYHPILVKIRVDQLMEKDSQGNRHWFGMNPGTFIQGALVSWDDEQRVYVVTVIPEGELARIHDRWPRVVGQGMVEQ